MTTETYKKAAEIQAELGNLENKHNTLIRLKEDMKTDEQHPYILEISSEIMGITFNREDMISPVIDLLIKKIEVLINQLEVKFAQL